jgi:hypothetical protein
LKAAVWGESDDSCHRGGSAVEKAKRKKFETESGTHMKQFSELRE